MGKTIKNCRNDGMRKIKPIKNQKPRKSVDIYAYSNDEEEEDIDSIYDYDDYDEELTEE